MTDATGSVTLAQSYTPYGDILSSAGSGVSVYQYTGEIRDVTGLTYLRARYLDSGVGRFISRDTWKGEYNRPLSFNRWGYVEGNPINLTDPSGHDPHWCGDNAQCWNDYLATMNKCQYNAALECFKGNRRKLIRTLMEISKLQNPQSELWNMEVERRKEIGNQLFPDENVTCTWGADCWRQMMRRAYYQQSRVVLQGKAVEIFKSDPEFINKHFEIVTEMQRDSRYRVEDFSDDFIRQVTFGQYGGPGLIGKLIDATHSETWMVRLAQVYANAHATISGDIFINWHIVFYSLKNLAKSRIS
ncbi:MAG: RHS repeat-associated core domain-containing protein [Anaerolineales bacterium]|nr:RHS repeat-associated core domain-containing protein [Anaerolineales bacterium]